jgi:CheY-like chemotaxis protein
LNVETIDVGGLISDLSIVLSRSVDKKIRIRSVVDQMRPITVDTNQIFQGLLNICNNACDSMPDGGELLIECSEFELGDEYAKSHADAKTGDYCKIQISDTGTGMSEEVKRRIFEPFFTTKGAGKGTGLGLSVTHGIIKSHNGQIDVRSAPGKGTVFMIYLPLLPLKEEVRRREDDGTIRRGDETVLIIDDEVAVAKVGEKMLKSCGYKTYKALGGREGVEIFEKHNDKIALVVLDMIMPEMDGQDVYRELKKIKPEVKVIIASGYSSDGRIGTLLDEGADGFLQKPFRVKELADMARNILDL